MLSRTTRGTTRVEPCPDQPNPWPAYSGEQGARFLRRPIIHGGCTIRILGGPINEGLVRRLRAPHQPAGKRRFRCLVRYSVLTGSSCRSCPCGPLRRRRHSEVGDGASDPPKTSSRRASKMASAPRSRPWPMALARPAPRLCCHPPAQAKGHERLGHASPGGKQLPTTPSGFDPSSAFAGREASCTGAAS